MEVEKPHALLVEEPDWAHEVGAGDLSWETLPRKWPEGGFVGNGRLGAVAHLADNHQIRFTVGRSDVTDHRDETGIFFFDKARLPIGHLELATIGAIETGSMRLDIWNAELKISLVTSRGTISLRLFADASADCLVFVIESSGGEKDCYLWFHPETVLNPRKVFLHLPISETDHNPSPTYRREGPEQIWEQYLHCGWSFASVLRWSGQHEVIQRSRSGGPPNAWRHAFFFSIGYATPGGNAASEAVKHVSDAARIGFPRLTRVHQDWWHSYFRQSFVRVPDKRIQSFYWLQVYKLASATREGGVPMDLMGPWYAPTGWPGVWWNLNIQLCYYPVLKSNRLELMEPFMRMLDENFANGNLSANVPPEWAHDSAAVASASSYDCRQPLGGPQGVETANLLWACHVYFLYCRYAGDAGRKQARLLPLLAAAVAYYLHMLVEGSDGRLHLPPLRSPEICEASDANYDLGFLRWGLNVLILSTNPGDPRLPLWEKTLRLLADFPSNETGLMIGAGVPLTESHRHFSHLVAIWPTWQIDPAKADNRALIEQSTLHWLSMPDELAPYSYVAAASIFARLKLGVQAVQAIHDTLDSHQFSRSSMYLGPGPTLETPLAVMTAVHDVLLDDESGEIVLFPGVPESWCDAAFDGMRTQCGLVIGATRTGGVIREIRLHSRQDRSVFVSGAFKQGAAISASPERTARFVTPNRINITLKACTQTTLSIYPNPSQDIKVQSVHDDLVLQTV